MSKTLPCKKNSYYHCLVIAINLLLLPPYPPPKALHPPAGMFMRSFPIFALGVLLDWFLSVLVLVFFKVKSVKPRPQLVHGL